MTVPGSSILIESFKGGAGDFDENLSFNKIVLKRPIATPPSFLTSGVVGYYSSSGIIF